ncbi:hypothetical protein [Vibrio harveyi]|uniref:hypothetical protein n=1 Tax=Vibrio harveyi TaxID=669 RepID=UPI003909FE1D
MTFGERLMESANQALELARTRTNITHVDRVKADAIYRANINLDNPTEAEKKFLAMWDEVASDSTKEQLVDTYIKANEMLFTSRRENQDV